MFVRRRPLFVLLMLLLLAPLLVAGPLAGPGAAPTVADARAAVDACFVPASGPIVDGPGPNRCIVFDDDAPINRALARLARVARALIVGSPAGWRVAPARAV